MVFRCIDILPYLLRSLGDDDGAQDKLETIENVRLATDKLHGTYDLSFFVDISGNRSARMVRIQAIFSPANLFTSGHPSAIVSKAFGNLSSPSPLCYSSTFEAATTSSRAMKDSSGTTLYATTCPIQSRKQREGEVMADDIAKEHGGYLSSELLHS